MLAIYTFPPPLCVARKVDWWVVSRVVGPKGLLNAAQDIELKQQLGRLELPGELLMLAHFTHAHICTL